MIRWLKTGMTWRGVDRTAVPIERSSQRTPTLNDGGRETATATEAYVSQARLELGPVLYR
jgi:hypothetical protein